jgi:hypothetical protein
MRQAQLTALYHETWPKLNSVLPKDRNISNPLFIHVPEAYETAKLRLVIVGRETHGWHSHLGDPAYPTDPDMLIAKYQKFDLGRDYVSSPFWWAAHNLQKKFAPEVPPFGFVWSNLFICDQNQTTPQDDVADLLREHSILRKELAILQPDVVVFFTGWNPYDYTVRSLFPGIEIAPADGGEGKLLARLKHPDLPIRSFRTYHPKYLRLKGKMGVLDEIRSLVT